MKTINNNKGLTLVELLIVIVVLGVLSAFATLLVSQVIENTRKNAFVQNTISIVDAARNAFIMDSSIWDDNQVTLQELLDSGYLEKLNQDPWGGEYKLDESYIIAEDDINGVFIPSITLSTNSNFDTKYVTFKVSIYTTIASIGFEEPISDYDKTDIVFAEEELTIIDQIIQNFDNDLEEDVTTDNGDDELSIKEDIQDNASIDTMGGNDIINIGDDIKDNASVSTGNGDDTINMDGEVKDNATIDTGDGNDTVNIKDDIQENSIVKTGNGDDTVSVGDDLQNGALLDTGDGNDTVTVGDDLDKGTLNTGDGDDSIVIQTLRNKSYIITGNGNDTVLIKDVSSSYKGSSTLNDGDDTLTIYDNTGWSKYLSGTKGTFDGGNGTDTLHLPYITEKQWNKGIYKLFKNFEVIQLQDTTINN